MPGPLYLAIAEVLERDVGHGRLVAGERLPTHRELAQRLGVHVGTITRAYAEAARRGLVDGEVGRGTFVRRPGPGGEFSRGEGGARAAIDFAFNLPAGGPSDAERRAALTRLAQRSDLGPCFDAYHQAGLPEQRAAGARWLARSGVAAAPERVLVTGGAQHGMAVALLSTGAAGDTLLVESLTYPGAKALAQLLDRRLEPVAVDAHGIVPEALDEACERTGARVLYCMPSMHNPTGTLLSEERRRAVGQIARARDLAIVEDDSYGFLCDPAPAPIQSFAPERTYFVATLSKCLGPGLRVGYLLAPSSAAFERLVSSASAMTWMAAPLMGELARLWIEDGTAARVVAEKRAEARARQALAHALLPALRTPSDPGSTHLWLELPPPWTTAELTARARERGVALSPSRPFVAGDAPEPHALRLCLATPSTRTQVEAGLVVLRELLDAGPSAAQTLV
jgi:DNA-binding transcriptional MocR family regulator